MVRPPEPPSQTWKTFLRNHAEAIAAIDMCVVPTLTFDLLFAFFVLGHGRRQLLWFDVTRHPTAEWLARQITEAFPWTSAPTYLVRDDDRAYGQTFQSRVRAMGIRRLEPAYQAFCVVFPKGCVASFRETAAAIYNPGSLLTAVASAACTRRIGCPAFGAAAARFSDAPAPEQYRLGPHGQSSSAKPVSFSMRLDWQPPLHPCWINDGPSKSQAFNPRYK